MLVPFVGADVQLKQLTTTMNFKEQESEFENEATIADAYIWIQNW